MKLVILMLALVTAVSGVRASEEEGLFIADHKVAPKQEFKDGEIIMRWKAERLELTRAVFRHDTEDKTRYWLELDFTKWADPGDFYLFKIDGKDFHGFVVRGEGTNERGGRWALGFTDPDNGRTLLAKIAKVYELPATHVLDQTKDGAHQPATRRGSKAL